MATCTNCFVGGSLAFVALVCSALGNVEPAFNFGAEKHALGSADVYGYATWSTLLGNLDLNGINVPMQMDFTSDPRLPPARGSFGRGWTIRFFSSVLVEEGQGVLRWHRPDGRIFYFSREQGDSRSSSSTVKGVRFVSTEGRWTAVKQTASRQTVLRHDLSGAELIYEEGLLVRFCLSKTVDVSQFYGISYTRFRLPQRLWALDSSKVLIEFSYDGAGRAIAFEIDKKVVKFQYDQFKTNQFSAETCLSKIDEGAQHPLSVTYRAEGVDADSVQLGRLGSVGDITFVWHARSGFLLKDGNAIYEIDNPSLVDGGRPATKVTLGEEKQASRQSARTLDYNWRPDEAKIRRKDNQGLSAFKYFDRKSGIATDTGANGVTTRTYFLLTPGPMMNKVRKIEEVKGNTVTVIERNAYDELGRLVRKIDRSGGVTVTEYSLESPNIRVIKDGHVIQETQLEAGRVTSVKEYDKGSLREFITSYTPTKIITFLENGKPLWRDSYRSNGTLEKHEDLVSQRTTHFDVGGRETATYTNGVLHSLRLYSDDSAREEIVVFRNGIDVVRVFKRRLNPMGGLVDETVEISSELLKFSNFKTSPN